MTLLRSCLALPKLVCIISCCPPALIPNALNYFDGSLCDALSDLINSSLPDWVCPVTTLGIWYAALHAPAMYFFQAQPHISSILGNTGKHSPLLAMALDSLRQANARPDWSLRGYQCPSHPAVPLTTSCH